MNKKMIITFMLAIAGSVWITSKALCLSLDTNAMYLSSISVSGTFDMSPMPCETTEEDEYPCPPCLTLVLSSADKLYYLTPSDNHVQARLEEIESLFSETPIVGTVFGQPYTQGSYDYIKVDSLLVRSHNIPSLCDEWNVLEYRYNSYWGGQDEFHTLHYTQKTDTFITNQRYAKLYKENNYLGALREGNNADIYYIPSDSTHEYLLYAFNAHVGDTLKNVWFGFQDKNHLPFQNVIVKEIQTTNPRTFVLDVERKFINDEIVHGELKWLEGIGFLSSPDGGFFDPLAGGFCYNVLCAYMEGEQVYTSEMGQKYGCYYDGNVPQTDTIPLFIKDGPGSSTVEPVDPNQIVAVLQMDVLSIYEYIGKEIGYKLSQTSSSSNAPVGKRLVKSDTFQKSVAVTLTESGTYLLELTHPDWDYSIVGTFEYREEKDAVINAEAAHPSAQKMLRDGQLLIRKGDKIYTLTGVQIQ